MAFANTVDDRYFEDYIEGDVHSFGSVEVTEDEIISFGKRFDPQRIHTDPGAAKLTPFGGKCRAILTPRGRSRHPTSTARLFSRLGS